MNRHQISLKMLSTHLVLMEAGRLKLGEIEGREEKGATEDDMVGWHH